MKIKLPYVILLGAALACGAPSLLADTTATAKTDQKVSITIEGTPKAIKGTTYRWTKDGVLIRPTSPWLVFNHVQPADAGTYKVTISDSRGTIISDQATIVVVKAI